MTDRCGEPNPNGPLGSQCVIMGHNHQTHRALYGDRWPAREIGRDTSWNLGEIRTVLSRAETALDSLHTERVEAHYWHGANASASDPCPANCPGRTEEGRYGEIETARYPDPDYADAKAALETLIDALGKYRRTGRPRKEKP